MLPRMVFDRPRKSNSAPLSYVACRSSSFPFHLLDFLLQQLDGQDTRDRLSAVVANSLTQAKTQDLARQAYQSRTQFHRLFRTVVEETPAAMRRRLLLERAAYQLGHTGMSVTEVALRRQLQFARGVHSRFPKSISDFSQHISALA